MNLPIYIYFLIPCILSGVTVYFQPNAPFYLKLFPVLLVLNIIVEVLSPWMVIRFGSSVELFNFYTAFELSCYIFILREIIVGPIARKIALHLIWIYPLFCIINIFFVQGLHSWHSLSYSIGNLLIVGYAIYYFFELFKRPKAINLIKEPAFWICSGLLFFYTCSFPFLGIVNIIAKAPAVILNNFGSIISVLNILLFSLFTIAFLCRVDFRNWKLRNRLVTGK